MNAQQRSSHHIVAILLTGVIGLSLVGLIRGIRYDVPHRGELAEFRHDTTIEDVAAEGGAVPATPYWQMRRRETGPTSQWKYGIAPIETVFDYRRCITCHDPHTLEIRPDQRAKERSLKIRATRRAYNGAPPVIPHAVEQTDDAACMACHGTGARIGELVANRIPHAYLSQCLQCHAPPAPLPLADRNSPPANSFAGLPTPSAGPRAYPGAPPLIPHSTWMRQDCLSCHGGVAGWPGLEVTHRWRTNCLQCHGTSAALEQAITAAR